MEVVVPTMTSRSTRLLCLLLAPLVSAYWEAGDQREDPYTAAIRMSKHAAADPDVMRNDPDHFRKLFGRLAIEQSQAKHMDETQSQFTPKDRCLVCHGVVNEFEIMMKSEKGKGGRNLLAVTNILEKVCHLDRYANMDPVDLKQSVERSRLYGGIAPPIFANACKRVVDSWQDDDDEIEPTLRDGGDPKEMHKELRYAICHRPGGVCDGLGMKVIPNPHQEGGLMQEGADETCKDPNAKKKKKKKKAADPITGM